MKEVPVLRANISKAPWDEVVAIGLNVGNIFSSFGMTAQPVPKVTTPTTLPDRGILSQVMPRMLAQIELLDDDWWLCETVGRPDK